MAELIESWHECHAEYSRKTVPVLNREPRRAGGFVSAKRKANSNNGIANNRRRFGLVNAKNDYRATDKLISECYDRVLFKLLDPEVVEFAEFVIMLNRLGKNATLVGDLERNGDLDFDEGVRQSISEELFNGMYDDDFTGRKGRGTNTK